MTYKSGQTTLSFGSILTDRFFYIVKLSIFFGSSKTIIQLNVQLCSELDRLMLLNQFKN